MNNYSDQFKSLVNLSVNSLKNIVLFGCYENKFNQFLKSKVNLNNYTLLFGLNEINNIKPFIENPFILETDNKDDLKKLDSSEVLYTLIETDKI